MKKKKAFVFLDESETKELDQRYVYIFSLLVNYQYHHCLFLYLSTRLNGYYSYIIIICHCGHNQSTYLKSFKSELLICLLKFALRLTLVPDV